jgi:lysophospholipase L1-like esterase
VAPAERWPDRLVAALDPGPPAMTLVANLGVDGFTTTDVIRAELPVMGKLALDFASLLIGVNDVVRGVPAATYEANVATILDTLLTLVPPDRLVTVSIPDYTVTPAGGDFGDQRQQHDGIVRHNKIMARLAADRGIAFVDIFDISLEAATDRSLVANDGLHPSGVQYRRWVERIRPVVEELLGRGDTAPAG